MLDDEARAPTPRASNARRKIGGLIFTAILVGFSGFFHCTYGGSHGCDVVAKEEWGFYDQLVDLEQIEGAPIITLVGRARTIRALIRAGIFSLPPSFNKGE